MSLAVGTRLGPYEIVGPLGAGGMGEVYGARDTRLDRTVAIKVLPDALASDPEFLARFDREARAISALEHPHICPLYDVGREGGTRFLVMQHLDGETLADRLARGPLPLDEALEQAIAIASALDWTYAQGIVHRDLKPGNVFVAKADRGRAQAKLLDFGLAKTAGPAAAPAAGPPPTMTRPLTAQGAIVGTFQYMAPEQIEGHEASLFDDGPGIARFPLSAPEDVWRIMSDPLFALPTGWHRDGDIVALAAFSMVTRSDVLTLSMSDGAVRTIAGTPGHEHAARFSPDGTWLAFDVDDAVHVQPYPGPGRRVQVSPGAGAAPVWSPDGRELYYQRGSQLMAVPFSAIDGVTGPPRMLFEHPGQLEDIAPDGSRFLFSVPEQEDQPLPPLVVTLGWLNRLLPER